MLAASRVVDVVRQRLSESADPLHVLWCRTNEESRTQFSRQLCDCRGLLALVPVIVRSPIFVDPNAILSDLNRVLEDNKDHITRLVLEARQPIAIVLLARGDFRLSQTGSLIRLPDWFPGLGGTEIYVRVRDLLTDVEVIRFNAPEARAEDVAARLYEVEAATLNRLEIIFKTTPGRLDSLWTALANLRGTVRDRAALQQCLKGYRTHLNGLSEPRAYRPSLKAKASLLSDLLALVQRSTPDQLLALAKSLAAALGVPTDATSRLPMIAILLRPAAPMEAAGRFCHTLLASIIYGGYQFLNATAHAGDYPMVSAEFLYMNSRDLRRALQHAAEQMAGM